MAKRNKKLSCAIALAFTINMCTSVTAEALNNTDGSLLKKESKTDNNLTEINKKNATEVKNTSDKQESNNEKNKVSKSADTKNENALKDKDTLKDDEGSDKKESSKEESNLYDKNLYKSDNKKIQKAVNIACDEDVIENINIVSKTNITKEQAKKWATDKKATQTFIDLADLFWKYAKEHGNINPAIAYVQSAKETGYGRFGGIINESYHNTCGLKNSGGGGDNDPNAHHKFNTWDEGVQAHLDHLALYAGADGYPKQNTYDPRHFASIKGRATTLAELGGKWAPNEAYGKDLIRMYNEVLNTNVDTDNEENNNTEENNNENNNGSNENNHNENNGNNNGGNENNNNGNNENNNNENTNQEQIKEGKWVDVEGEKYFVKADGNYLTGWLEYKGVKYYLSPENGTMVKGWCYDNGKWYYLAKDGSAVKGIQKLDGRSYYFDQSTGVMKTGWIKSNDGTRYFEEDGTMKNGWNKIENDWFSFDENGVIETGWKTIEDNHFYFDDNGKMQIGWTKIDEKEYYFDENGVMQKGWFKEESWFHFNKDGIKESGWQTIDGKEYYFYNDGKMAESTTIDGKLLGEDGSVVEDNNSTSQSKDKLIVIDPGHDYGKDYGSVGRVNGQNYEETVLNMEVAVQVKNALEAKGYIVKMTRQPWDRPVSSSLTESLSRRTSFANSLGADLFISIHHDSATASAHGITTFYSSYKPGIDNEGIKQIAGWGGTVIADTTPSEQAVKGKNVAQKIVNELSSRDSYYNRGAYDRNLFVTKNTNMPSLLIECGFLTNPSEAAKSADLENQKRIGNIVADSVESEF